LIFVRELKRKVVRWGIIGGGDVIARKSGPAIIGVSGSKLTAVMCRSEVNAKEVTKKLGAVNYYTNAEDLVRDPEVDIVYIATPPGAHMEYALLVAKYKKACLLEKPFARSAYECREIIDAFGRSGSSLFVAYYRRAHDRWRLAQKLVQNHLGTVTSISLKLHRSDHLLDVLDEGKDARNFGWRVNAEQAGGGLFMDLGCHMLDILDFLVGPIENVQGDAVRLFSPKYDVENVVSMTFRTKAGALGTASWNFVSSSFEDKLEIVGTNATLRMSFFGKDFPVISYSDSDSVEVPPDSPVPEFVHQGLIQEIVNELRGANGWKCQSNGVSALRTAKVMDSVLRRFYRSRDDDFWKRPNTWLN
jgi:predicted dehydrogenase